MYIYTDIYSMYIYIHTYIYLKFLFLFSAAIFFIQLNEMCILKLLFLCIRIYFGPIILKV